MSGNIVLTGFMGTGKSAVGRLLAAELSRDFVDADRTIVQRHGPIDAIFASDGEAGFRSLEHELAQELAERSDLVIASGGGMLIDPAVAATLAATGRIFCLTAPAATIIARVLADDGASRPLLAGPDPLGRVVELLTERADRYGAFEQVDTEGRTPSEVATDIAERLSLPPTDVLGGSDPLH